MRLAMQKPGNEHHQNFVNSRILLFICRKSNHVFTMWQCPILTTIRQYELKEELLDVCRVVNRNLLHQIIFMIITYFSITTLQKFTESQRYTARKHNFVIHCNQWYQPSLCKYRFDRTLNSRFTVLYCTNRIERKYVKLSNETDELQQIICNIRIIRDPTRHENLDSYSP